MTLFDLFLVHARGVPVWQRVTAIASPTSWTLCATAQVSYVLREYKMRYKAGGYLAEIEDALSTNAYQPVHLADEETALKTSTHMVGST
ncbi:MAG: hypothetical protein R2873_27405 [Caldilineaceae bacterium]